MRRIMTQFVTLLATALMLTGCASFSILTPASSATAVSPVPTDIYWNANLKDGTLSIAIDAVDVTSQFSVPTLSSDSHAKANLNLTQGAHTISVAGALWNSLDQAYELRSASETFQVANAPGRPVTYTQTIFNYTPGWPAGQLGVVSFGGADPQATHRNVNLIFTFDGNTSDVVAFSVPRIHDIFHDGTGYEIVTGTATITVQDAASGSVIAQATFLPQARIFVSVDNGNGGIGFGCLGALPSDPTFPDHGVEVAYPYALFIRAGTDLISDYSVSSSWALSTAGFNGSPNVFGTDGACSQGIPLGTTLGVLQIKSNCQQDVAPAGSSAGIFTTVVH